VVAHEMKGEPLILSDYAYTRRRTCLIKMQIVLPNQPDVKGWGRPKSGLIVYESKYKPIANCQQDRRGQRVKLFKERRLDQLLCVPDCCVRLLMLAVEELGGINVIPAGSPSLLARRIALLLGQPSAAGSWPCAAHR